MFVSFTAAQSSSNTQIELKNTEPTPLQTSEYADIWLEVRNTGNTEAKNIDIQFKENYPFKVDGDNRKNWTIPEIVPGDTYQLHLQTRVDNNAVQGNNTLNFDVKTPRLTYEEKVPVEVRSDQNVLSIMDIDFPQKAAPGSTNQMQIKMKNLASGQIKNIQVGLDITSEDLPMATSESSQKNIANIEAGETEKINYTLNIDESAENGVYKLPINKDFENEAGTAFEQSTTTGVSIGGEPRLEAALNTDKTLKDGSTEELTFRLVNRGHGSADFVSMSLEETDNIEVIGSKEVYIGSMDSDDFQTASFKINVDAETESTSVRKIEMPVKLEYTDSQGKQTETQTVQSELYTEQQLQEYGLDSNDNLIPIAVIGLVVVIGGLYYWRRKR